MKGEAESDRTAEDKLEAVGRHSSVTRCVQGSCAYASISTFRAAILDQSRIFYQNGRRQRRLLCIDEFELYQGR